jgi:DNA-binding HxlR family transcriptional regulator
MTANSEYVPGICNIGPAEIRSGELRFTELQRSMGDVNAVTLSNRLKRLETAGVIEREEATIDRRSVAYTLSRLGMGLLPVLREIQNFTRRNVNLGLVVKAPVHKAAGRGRTGSK